jgi:hypothetical protein
MFGVLGRAAVELAPGLRARMAAVNRALTGPGGYFSCEECEERWAISLPTTKACLYAPDPGTRRDAALAFGRYVAGNVETELLQDLTGVLGRLVDLLGDSDELVRAAAAATLGWRGNLSLVPALAAAQAKASPATEAVFDQAQAQIREFSGPITSECQEALGRELDPTEAIVACVWRKHLLGDWSFTFPEIPARKLSGATGRYAPISSQEVVLGLIDHTLFGSGKQGFLASSTGFYWNYVGPVDCGSIRYTEVEPSSVSYERSTRLLSLGGKELIKLPDYGEAIANFLYDVSYSLKSNFLEDALS